MPDFIAQQNPLRAMSSEFKPASAGRRPYIIYREPPGWGFWSNFSVVLQGLDEADKRNLVPVVDMERFPTRYNEDQPVHGTMNAWEYYFEQPTPLTLAEALTLDPEDSGGKVIDDPITTCYTQIAPPPETLKRGRELVRKYVRVLPEIQHRVTSLLPAGDDSRRIGVHVRGTDQRHGRDHPNHPVPAGPEAYLEQVVSLDAVHAFSHIVLATDEKHTVEMFAKQFGSRLCAAPAHRTAADDATTYGHDYRWLFEGSDRSLHRYQLGIEVLVDAMLLSRCGHLVCGASNVSQAAMYFASEGQVIHPVLPIWMPPENDQPSCGRAYIATLPAPTYPPSAAMLEHSIEKLRDILEYAENQRAEFHARVAALEQWNRDAEQRLLESHGHINRLDASLVELDARLRAAYQSNEEITGAHAAANAQVAQLNASSGELQRTVADLQERLSALQNRSSLRLLKDILRRVRRRLVG